MQAKDVEQIIKGVMEKFIDKNDGNAEKVELILDINKMVCNMVALNWRSAEVDKMKLGEVWGDYEPTEKMAVNHVGNQLNDLLRHLIDVKDGEEAKIETDDLDALYWATAILGGIEE